MLLMGKIPSAEHQARALRVRNPCSRVRTLSGKNPTKEGFEPHRIAERAPVGMSALTLPSEGDPIIGVYNTVL